MAILDALPHLPGCYLFLDSKGSILYVGKAKDLKKRVSSYFAGQNHSPKTKKMLEQEAGIDFIVTNNEVEAFLLENTLIKKHAPRYNIKLKDSSRYACIEITDDEFPRLRIARKIGVNGHFFGPFVSAKERTYVFQIVRKTFGLAVCRKLPGKPCLRYHLHSCSGPCTGKVSREDYLKQVDRAKSVLAGKTSEIMESMKSEMNEFSHSLDYEKALLLRDQIGALERLSERQRVEKKKKYDQDVISYIVNKENVYLMVFQVYKGTLEGKEDFTFEYVDDFLEQFLIQYYSENEPPEELIIEDAVDKSIIDFLEHVREKKVHVTVPKIGEKKEMLNLAKKNVEIAFLGGLKKVEALREALRLPKDPGIIECIDISHLAGTSTVGSLIQFRGGRPDKNNYRRFRIKTVEGIDDFASVAEVVKRRYSRLLNEKKELPDLIVIDGGRGQLSAALHELIRLNVRVPVISIAKGEEEIFSPGEDKPLDINKNSKASMFVQEIRDEAHRFAISYNRMLRLKAIQRTKKRRSSLVS